MPDEPEPEAEVLDPRDYLALMGEMGLGIGIPYAPHVWTRDMRVDQGRWFCRWCKVGHASDRAAETCPEHPPDVARLNG